MRKFKSSCLEFDWDFYEHVNPSGKHAAHECAPRGATRAHRLRSNTVLVEE